MASRKPFRRAAFVFDSTLPLHPTDPKAEARMARARRALQSARALPVVRAAPPSSSSPPGAEAQRPRLVGGHLAPTASALWAFAEDRHFSSPGYSYIASRTRLLLHHLRGGRVLLTRGELGAKRWAGAFGAMAVFDAEFATMLVEALHIQRLVIDAP